MQQQSLYYIIADHLIEIETENKELTKMLLPNFSDFEVVIKKADNPLFRFLVGTNIRIPKVDTLDTLKAEDIFSKVYTDGDYIFAEVEINGTVHNLKADTQWKVIETDLSLSTPEEMGFFKHFIVTAYGMATAPLKTIKVHASVIEKNGKALLFIGPSGTGKSTHSSLWLKHIPGAKLLNDDEPIVRILDDGSVRVYGAPWSGSTPCYRNASAEVAGIIHLYQSPENKLTKLDPMSAVSALIKQCNVFRSDLNNKSMIGKTVFEIVSKIPVYRLDCRADREAVSMTEPLIV